MTRHTEDRQTGQRGVVRAFAAVGALGALAVLVLVVPYVLVALTQALPLDLGALSPASWGRADDGRLLLLAIVGVAWAAWVVMVLSVGLETWAAVRRVPTPTLPGMVVPQRMAAVLVASILVALSPGPAAPAVGEPVGSGASGGASAVALSVAPPGLWRGPGAATSGAADQVGAVRAEAARVGTDLVGADRVEAVRVGTDRVDIEDLRERSRVSRSGLPMLEQSAGGPAAPTVTTERHDTLWLLAEQYLGAGERFVEIVELNRGEVQPDGRSLGDDGRLYPGWTLALPADAAVGAVRPDRHRVVRGDTLWQIAEDELGDARRFPELAEANRGDLQPDGRSLAEPDLILPGWILEIPGRVDTASRPAPDQSPEAVEREAAAEARAAAGLRAADLEAGADAPEADAPEADAPVASGSASDGTDEDAQGAPDAAIPLPGPIAMAPIDRAATDPSASTAPPAQTAPPAPDGPASGADGCGWRPTAAQSWPLVGTHHQRRGARRRSAARRHHRADPGGPRLGCWRHRGRGAGRRRTGAGSGFGSHRRRHGDRAPGWGCGCHPPPGWRGRRAHAPPAPVPASSSPRGADARLRARRPAGGAGGQGCRP